MPFREQECCATAARQQRTAYAVGGLLCAVPTEGQQVRHAFVTRSIVTQTTRQVSMVPAHYYHRLLDTQMAHDDGTRKGQHCPANVLHCWWLSGPVR